MTRSLSGVSSRRRGIAFAYPLRTLALMGITGTQAMLSLLYIILAVGVDTFSSFDFQTFSDAVTIPRSQTELHILLNVFVGLLYMWMPVTGFTGASKLRFGLLVIYMTGTGIWQVALLLFMVYVGIVLGPLAGPTLSVLAFLFFANGMGLAAGGMLLGTRTKKKVHREYVWAD